MKTVKIASATGMNGAIRQNPGYEVDLRKYSIDSGLSNRVGVLGNRTDLRDLMAASDCFCLPSNREVMPISCIEAMAAGVAVVSTDTGGIGQLLKNGSDALIVPRNDLDALTAALVARGEECPAPVATRRVGEWHLCPGFQSGCLRQQNCPMLPARPSAKSWDRRRRFRLRGG